MNDKEKYIHFCETHPSVPIYMRHWWLNCNCGTSHWDVLLYENSDGGIEAFMTFFTPYRKVIAMPFHSQSMGIWFNPEYDDQNYTRNIGRKHKICDSFIERMPPFETYRQNFHYTFTDWLPFYWKGFGQTTRYDYVIPDISDTKLLWNGLSEIRAAVNRARNRYKLTVIKGITFGEFLTIYRKTYQRQHIKTPTINRLQKIIDTCLQRQQGEMWGACDSEGRLHAVLFVAWQESCAYAIASGRDPDIPNSLAPTLLFWESICFCSSLSKSFDCEGSMLKGVEFFLRKFGGIQHPYFEITKGRRGVRATINAVKNKLLGENS